jgi:hypothetical protein
MNNEAILPELIKGHRNKNMAPNNHKICVATFKKTSPSRIITSEGAYRRGSSTRAIADMNT